MHPVLKFSACLSMCVCVRERKRDKVRGTEREKFFFPHCLEQLNYSEIICPLQD